MVGQTGVFGEGELAVLKPEAEVIVSARGSARLMLIGGAPSAEKRHIFRNFVSSREERIEQVKTDWRADRFARVPDEHDFIPLPADLEPVRYP